LKGNILYFLDARGMTQAYRSQWALVVQAAGLRPSSVLPVTIYRECPKPLVQHSTYTWKLNPAHFDTVRASMDKLIHATHSELIVTCDPAVLGVVTGLQQHSIDKVRGSVYEYTTEDERITCKVVVTYPINVLHTFASKKQRGWLDDEEGDESTNNTYTVKAGRWILLHDWSKAGRVFRGETRPEPEFKHFVVKKLEDAEIAAEYLMSCQFMSHDIETKGAKHCFMTCVGYTGVHADGRIISFVFPFYDQFIPGGMMWTHDELVKLWKIVQRINASPVPKGMQNGTYDSSHGVKWRAPCDGYYLDSMHLWHSLYPELPKSLDFITSLTVDTYQYWKSDIKGIEDKDETRRDTDMERYWEYNAKDCHYTALAIKWVLDTVVSNEWALRNYMEEFMLAIIAWNMSMRGFATDEDRRLVHEKHLNDSRAAQIQRLRVLTGQPEFNPESVPQKQWLIYDVLGCRDYKIKRKNRSTAAASLNLMRLDHPIFRRYIDALRNTMRPRKRISDFIDVKIWGNRYRTKLAPVTETWRFTSKSSDFWDGRNQQNIPTDLRDWMIASPGHVLVNLDYSQSDAVWIAFESEDEKYMATMTSGKDTHAIHAAHFFQLDVDEILAGVKKEKASGEYGEYMHPQKGIRPITKRVVHGANFQMMGKTLYYTMGREAVMAAAIHLGHVDALSWKEEQLWRFCQRILDSFRQLYPRLSQKEWYGEIAASLKTAPALANAFGMVRTFFGDVGDSDTQREATAFYGQSDTAGNINRSLLEYYFGWVPKSFRDGPNDFNFTEPDNRVLAESRFGSQSLDGRHQLERDGFRLLLQVHDSIIAEVPLARYVELINKALTVMERKCIVHGRKMYVPAEALVGFRWGDDANMLKFDPKQPPSLAQLQATWDTSPLKLIA